MKNYELMAHLARRPPDEKARGQQAIENGWQQAVRTEGQQEEQIMRESVEEYIARKYGMEELLWRPEKKEKGR